MISENNSADRNHLFTILSPYIMYSLFHMTDVRNLIPLILYQNVKLVTNICNILYKKISGNLWFPIHDILSFSRGFIVS